MVFRFLLRFLLSDNVINKLSESYPIRRAAKWVVYFLHKTNAIKENQKISLNQENLNTFQKLSERLIHFWQQRVKSIKPNSNESLKDQYHARYKADSVNKSETCNPVSNNKQTGRQDKTVEERMKDYIEELKKRSQQQ